MITKAKVKQLEKRYKQTKRNKKKTILVRHIRADGQLVNTYGKLLSKEELEVIRKEDEENEEDDRVVTILQRTYL